MVLGDVASWVTIVGFPLGVVGATGTFATIASVGRQRGLRQQLREVLDPVMKACNEYQYSNRVHVTEGFLRASAEKLRILSERDGLKSPNKNHIGQLRDILMDIAGRFDIPTELPTEYISPEQRAGLVLQP